MHKYLLIVFFTFSFSSLFGQGEQKSMEDGNEVSQFSLEGNYSLGKIIRHNTRFRPEVTELSSAADISFIKHTHGNKDWHQLSNYASVISTFQYGRFGDHDVFGSVYALMLGLQHSKKVSALGYKLNRQFRYRFGPSWLDRPYNVLNNFDNNVIGSHLNLTLRLDYGYEWILNDNIGVHLSAAIQHYSNGRSALPNLGINLFAMNLALKFHSSNSFTRIRRQNKEIQKEVDKRHKLNIRMGYARHENFIVGGPKYPIYTFSVYGSKSRGPIWTWLYGLEGSYFESVSQYIFENETGDKHPHRVATRLTPFGGFELRLGMTSFVGTLGSYFYKPFLAAGFLPTKVGFQQYIPVFRDDRDPSLFIGGYLKAHGAKAEYVEFGLGYRF